MAQVIFSRRHHPGSVLLRAAMWSPWSHCGIIDPARGTVIQAVAGAGVVEVPLAHFQADASRWAIVEFSLANDNDTIKAARDQINKPYDLRGVLGVGTHRRWNDPDAWFCSELVAHALRLGGVRLFRDEAWRITPQHLWMLDLPILAAA